MLGGIIRQLGVKVSLLFDKKAAKEVGSAVESIRDGMKSLAFQTSLAAGSLLGIAKITSGHARALQQTSAMLGINVEKLQELDAAARVVAGVGAGELTSALEGISKTLFDFRNNSPEAGATLSRLGVPLELLGKKGVTADEILISISDTFKNMPDGIYKTQLAAEAFGGSIGPRLIPLLNQGSAGIHKTMEEMKKLGIVLGPDATKTGTAFDQQLTKIFLVLQNITYLIGFQLIKYIGPLVTQFQKFILHNRQFLALGMAAVFKSLGVFLGIIYKVVSELAEKFKDLVSVLGGVEKTSRLVAIGLAIIGTTKILNGVIALGAALRTVSGVMTLLGGPITLISLGLITLALIFQDFFSKDSLIKEWFKEFDTWTDQIFEKIQKLGDQFEILKKLKDYFKGQKTFLGIPIVPGGASEPTPSLNPFASPNKATVPSSGRAPASADAPHAQNTYHTEVNFQLAPGADTAATTAAVLKGVDQGIGAAQLRATRDQYLGGIA